MAAAPTLSYDTHDAILAYWNAQGPLRVGLMTAAAAPDSSSISEPASGAGYLRQPVTLAPFTRDGTGISSTINAAPMVFTASTSAWPAVSWAGLFSASGRLLAQAPLPAPRVVVAGDSISFGAGAFQFRLK